MHFGSPQCRWEKIRLLAVLCQLVISLTVDRNATLKYVQNLTVLKVIFQAHSMGL